MFALIGREMLIPLSNLITYRETADSGSLNRYNRLRAVTLKASLAPGYSLGQACSNALEEMHRV